MDTNLDHPAAPTRRRRVARFAPLLVLLVPAVIAASILVHAHSGPASDAGATCRRPSPEPVDPQSGVHLLANAPEPVYRTDPPTSGPHVMNPAARGAVQTPLSRPVQVGVLERGDVLVQYGPEVTATDRAELEALAGDEVVVAPNPGLSASVVATAWHTKLNCSGVDTAALQSFVVATEGTRAASNMPRSG